MERLPNVSATFVSAVAYTKFPIQMSYARADTNVADTMTVTHWPMGTCGISISVFSRNLRYSVFRIRYVVFGTKKLKKPQAPSSFAIQGLQNALKGL